MPFRQPNLSAETELKEKKLPQATAAWMNNFCRFSSLWMSMPLIQISIPIQVSSGYVIVAGPCR